VHAQQVGGCDPQHCVTALCYFGCNDTFVDMGVYTRNRWVAVTHIHSHVGKRAEPITLFVAHQQASSQPVRSKRHSQGIAVSHAPTCCVCTLPSRQTCHHSQSNTMLQHNAVGHSHPPVACVHSHVDKRAEAVALFVAHQQASSQ
jgi:hypothetical protein